MSELTRKQARILKRQISKLYGRNYIPLITSDSTLSIGDILLKKKDIIAEVDSSVFNPSNVMFVEGKKVNKNITSSASVNLTTKLKGEAVMSEHFKVNEAGLAVEFSNENEMFLKVQGVRQQSIKNFVEFRKELLSKYVSGELSSKVYVVKGLVYADKYYLQFSGNKGGSLGFNLDAKANTANADVDANFSLKWKKSVGYNIDGVNGGVLAYRVAGVRLNRHLTPSNIHENILNGMSEADALDMVSFSDRKKLITKKAIEIVDLTDEVLLYNQEDYV
ncbi:hypothetical protein [Pontimicrobium sp. IMCC45349]|uniref:hypothetical protein n=1 Tax=Pontimicrobium sp. IMCC45349 TaxID=3391574 RepID=UPI0039A05F1D